MLYLIASVLTSSSVSIFMRISEKHVKNNFAMFMANYFVCAAIAASFLLASGKTVAPGMPGMTFAILLGAFGGLLYLSAFILLKFNIGKNGVMLSSVFMKLGVLVPTLMAIIIFREAPTYLQIIGMAIAVAAIVVIYFDPGSDGNGLSSKKSKASLLFLLALLLLSGLVESLANIYNKLGNESLKDLYMVCVFSSAMLISLVFVLIKRQPICFADIAFGILIGIPNYFSTRFLLKALETVPAFVTYPVYNIGAIILIGIAGILIFKEKASTRKYIGFAMIIAALILLNV
ncbi:MAG: hypothetical protein IJM18_10850 [Clostridia bacterium]|nr:hypothetical protein [Clostridia bacterium]